jgi:membrane associated rhomboid family serine protease
MKGSKRQSSKKKSVMEEKKAGDGVSWWDTTAIQSSTFFSTNVNFGADEDKKKKKGKKGAKRKKTAVRKDEADAPIFAESSEEKSKDKGAPLILLDNPSPAIWTYGSVVIFVIVLACEIFQTGTVLSFAKNPMIGPSEEVMILMGAKQGKRMLDGDWWRFITAIFLHSGVIHMFITIAFIINSKSVEIETGFWRSFFVFFLSGIFGYILSCLLIPEMVSCGATGCGFGFIGLQLSDLISSWRMKKNPGRSLGILLVSILIGVILGLTPYLDNFCNLGGLIMGGLFALMLLPNITFGNFERICRGFIAFIAFPITTVLFCFGMVIFYRRIDGNTWCTWCTKINCININKWCPNITESEVVEYHI